MLIPPPFFILLIFLLFTSLTLHAETNDWQQFQSQATQAYQTGDYLQAEHAIRQAIAVTDKADNGAAYKASSLNLLAFIQSAQGELSAAIETIDVAVSLGKNALGRPNEQLAALLFNQGILLQQADKPGQALTILEQAIHDYLSLNSTGDGNLWQAALAQAQLLAGNDPEKAISTLTAALSGYSETSGFTHQPTVQQFADLALLYGQIEIDRQHYSSASTILEQARQRLTPSTESNRLIALLELLANSYDNTGQTEKSTPIHEQVLALRQQGPVSMSTVMHLNELAMRHQENQQFTKAEQLYQQGLDALKQLNKTASIEQALMLANLASVKLSQKDHQAALALFERSYHLHQKLNLRPLNASRTAGYVGTLYYNQHQYKQAEAAFLQALSWLDGLPEANDESVLIALQNLNALYISWDKPNKARTYDKRARELKKKINKIAE